MRRTILILGTIGNLVGPLHLAYAIDYTYGTLDVCRAETTLYLTALTTQGRLLAHLLAAIPCPEAQTCMDFYSGGKFSQIDVPGGTYTEAFGINNAGQIVGWYQVDGSGQFGFVDTAGSFSQIQFGPTYTIAHGINDLGAIVGYWNDIAGQHGFLLVGGGFTTLDEPSQSGNPDTTRAYGINNSGQVAGSFGDVVGSHGFLYSGGAYTQIDFPGAYGATQVFGVNDLGWIVGIGSAGAYVDAGGNFSRLAVPGAVAGPLPLGINHQGQVVGYYEGTDSTMHGFVATPISFAGTPGKPNCHVKSVSALVRQYGGLNGAAAALDYATVNALQEAIESFCGG